MAAKEDAQAASVMKLGPRQIQDIGHAPRHDIGQFTRHRVLCDRRQLRVEPLMPLLKDRVAVLAGIRGNSGTVSNACANTGKTTRFWVM